jgi:hypothetical protein
MPILPHLPHIPLRVLVASAVVVGILSVLLLNKQISKSIRLFREGFDRHLLWTYWGLFKEKGWEIFWGPTVLSIAFGLLTLWYTPTLVWFGVYLLTVFFMTGYYLWRDGYVRLQPKFAVLEAMSQPTETEQKHVMNMFIQIIPTCLSDALVYECRGRLLRVCHRHVDSDEWEVTRMDSPLFLEWDYYGSNAMMLEPGIRQRLNVCFWSSESRFIVPAVQPLPSKFRVVFDRLGEFKFDIRMTAKDCSPVNVALLVRLDLNKWDEPIVKLIAGGHSVRELRNTIRISEV